MPAWAETARQLEAESLRQARLIRILVVLARRQEPIPRTLEELEKVFLDILVDDLKRIRSTLPGLAEAVMDAAAIREVGYGISRKTLIALADYHQPGAGIPTLLAEANNNPRWQSLAPLLSPDPEYDLLRFHHDELAEGLLLAGEQGLLEPYVDDAWRKVVLDLLINRGCKSSSSYALYGFVRKHRDLITKEQALSYIRQLLSAENGHHAYLTLIVDEALKIEHQERLDLLLSAALFVPTNLLLWKTVWLWIQRHYQSKEERGEILQQLYQSGCQDSEILNRLLQCRPPQEARNYAKEWLAERTTHPYVLCRCLELLGEEAKDQARQLLDDPTTLSNVLCRCLELLGEEAKDQAKLLLDDPTTLSDVLCRCLELLGEEAKDQARQLLDDPTTSSDVLCRCLELLGEEAKDQAKLLLVDSKDKEVLCRCLELLGEEAKDQAKLLLVDPTTSFEVLCRCLELLGEEAKDQARQLLVDSKDHQVLCRCLELLKEEAKPFATERIRYWTETEAKLLVRCFQVAGETPEAEKAANEMLTAWDKRVPALLRVAALRAPFDTALRTQRAREVLDDWHRQYRRLVAAALMAFWNNPDAVTRDCRDIISRWHPEIVYRHKNRKRLQLLDYDGHIIKALFHPALRKEASQAAQAMLYKENDSPGFLSPELHRQAENIIRGEWQPWAVPGEGITQEQSEQVIILEPLPVVAQQERPPKPSSRQKAPKQTKKRTSSTPQEPTLEPWKQTLAKLQSSYQNEDTE